MTACYCKKCGIATKHRVVNSQSKLVSCEVCGMERWYAKAFGAGDFPELTPDENEIIHEARAFGLGLCFPAYPDANAQAQATLKAARDWLHARGLVRR